MSMVVRRYQEILPVLCVDTYFTAAWGFLLIPHFFRSHFSGWKSLRISCCMGMLVRVCFYVPVFLFEKHRTSWAMSHLCCEHRPATYSTHSSGIFPMCIRNAFPLHVGGTDSAVSPAHNESLTGACWKYKPATSPTHNGKEWCRLGGDIFQNSHHSHQMHRCIFKAKSDTKKNLRGVNSLEVSVKG